MQSELGTRPWFKLWRPLRFTGRDAIHALAERTSRAIHWLARPCPNFRHLDGSYQRCHCINRRNPRFPARERPKAQRAIYPVPDSNLIPLPSNDDTERVAELSRHLPLATRRTTLDEANKFEFTGRALQ